MVIKKYNGIKGIETKSQKEFNNLEDEIVWMKMLETIILQEHSLSLVTKIREHFVQHKILDVIDFNKFVEETAKEVKDIEYKKLKEQVDKKLKK